ncbi:MAG: GtrA family protein [Pseudoclavibacter sp.]
MSKLSRFLRENALRGGTFLVVGGVSFLVDAGVYNVLAFWGGRGPLFQTPLLAKAISIIVASVVSYLGSKLWTFRDSQRPASWRQFTLFMVLNLVAIALQMACLGFSRYVLHQADPFSDNLWGTFIGQIVATLFRYFTYGKWVFPRSSAQPPSSQPTEK